MSEVRVLPPRLATDRRGGHGGGTWSRSVTPERINLRTGCGRERGWALAPSAKAAPASWPVRSERKLGTDWSMASWQAGEAQWRSSGLLSRLVRVRVLPPARDELSAAGCQLPVGRRKPRSFWQLTTDNWQLTCWRSLNGQSSSLRSCHVGSSPSASAERVAGCRLPVVSCQSPERSLAHISWGVGWRGNWERGRPARTDRIHSGGCGAHGAKQASRPRSQDFFACRRNLISARKLSDIWQLARRYSLAGKSACMVSRRPQVRILLLSFRPSRRYGRSKEG